MLGLKKQIIKNYLAFKVTEITDTKIVLQNKNLSKIGEAYRGMEQAIFKLVQMMPGIGQINVDYAKGEATVIYDKQQISPSGIDGWINKILELIVNNLDFIQKGWETNPDNVLASFETELKKIIAGQKK
jgi:hypothetical protein